MNDPASANAAESPAARFEYFRGYPARFKRERRRAVIGSLGCWPGPIFLAALVGTACATYSIAESPSWNGSFLLLGLLGFTVCFGWGLWITLRVASQTTIVPYFQKDVGDIHTFAHGHAVARSCQALDELAAQLGLAPLSAFGFNDDFAGEQLIWHPPAQGLTTISGLVVALRDASNRLPGQEQVIRELAAIEHALQKAVNRDVSFCLLLRTCNATCAMEWEQRKGTCF